MHCTLLRHIPLLLNRFFSFYFLFINLISTFMKKNLFLTCALALFAIVGVSAQEWSRTLATGLPGKEITHDVNGTSVTQYRVETALMQNAGATGVRYTVVQTTATGAYGGGPFFAMGEMIVLNATGDTISYTATSNADHNSGGAGTDGAGLPALNDGNFNNFFHSSWGGTEPGGLHYLELTFAEPVDAFKLVWYTRPNQHVNRPQVVGLTNPGVEFTESMLFAEYEFQLGEQVTDLATLQAGGAFTLYVEGEDDLSVYGDNLTANGNTYVALATGGYSTGKYAEAAVQNIVQFIPARDGKIILYQPVSASYYTDPCRWTSNYNGKNGWLLAHADAQFLDEFTFIPAANGEFEITTELWRQQIVVDGSFTSDWADLDEPITVWVGYDNRGNLKIFDEAHKQALESGDYTQGFGIPVDFTFKINKASVSKEMVPDKTAQQMCSEVLQPTLKLAAEKQADYAEYLDYDLIGYADELAAAITAAEATIAEGDLAAAFKAKDAVAKAIAAFVTIKNIYYSDVIGTEDGENGGLWAEYNANKANSTGNYTPADAGKYTKQAEEALRAIDAAMQAIDAWENEDGTYLSYSQIESLYSSIESKIAEFHASKLAFSTFPEIVEDIPADNMSTEYPNNAVWKRRIDLHQATTGIRLTFLDRHIGTAGDQGNYPMIALGEFKLYAADGTEVALTADNFYANHTETNEGFESTVARLCDGNYGAQGYYHSPWSGNEPQEYIYLDVTFPESMKAFTFEVYSRDKSTSNGAVSLFPKKVAITTVGEAYDPLLFTENPYNVFVGEKVTSVDQITADGYYVIKGLLNTQSVLIKDENGEIVDSEPAGTAAYYHGISRFHANAAAVRAAGAYRFVPNGDGTFKVLSLGLAKYWPSTTANGFVENTTTYEADKAANVTIVPSTNIAEAFVMYEYNEGLTTDVEGEPAEGEETGEVVTYETPYVMFMDWYSGLATRPVTDPQPYRDADRQVVDGQGDALCFNKANGEGEWEIYKLDIENPDFFYLTNMVGVMEQLGLKVGTNPGEVANLGNLEGVLEAAQTVIADSAYAEAPAAAAALAAEIATVTKLEKNPMVEGVFQVVSANADFMNKQNVEKALYATVTADGTPTFGWKTIENDNIQFYFDFKKSDNAADLVASGKIDEADGDKVYSIRAIATYGDATPYYIGEADAKSTQIDMFADAWSDYVVLNVAGSAFNLSLAGKHADGFSLHANGHSGGAGVSSNIVYWNGDAGASQWYLRKVDYETSINDFVVEGVEVVAVSYYTPAGAAVPAPVQGVNIVVTVYANGVVETKKVLVK